MLLSQEAVRGAQTCRDKGNSLKQEQLSQIRRRQSESDREVKRVGLAAKKKPSTKLAPLRIKVQFKNANGIFDALLDSGASLSIINQKTMRANVQLGRKQVASTTKLQTVNSEVTSDGSAIIQFYLHPSSLRP